MNDDEYVKDTRRPSALRELRETIRRSPEYTGRFRREVICTPCENGDHHACDTTAWQPDTGQPALCVCTDQAHDTKEAGGA